MPKLTIATVFAEDADPNERLFAQIESAFNFLIFFYRQYLYECNELRLAINDLLNDSVNMYCRIVCCYMNMQYQSSF